LIRSVTDPKRKKGEPVPVCGTTKVGVFINITLTKITVKAAFIASVVEANP
jgi:hypothetical protein